MWHVWFDPSSQRMKSNTPTRTGDPNGIPKNRFSPHVLLSDPYAKSLSTLCQWGDAEESQMRAFCPRQSPIVEHLLIGRASRPKIAPEELIIYEMHVRCFTQHPSSHVKHPGKFLGIIEKIPYLKEFRDQRR